eukprot:7345682-Pyramimonas_sp.AAC.1
MPVQLQSWIGRGYHRRPHQTRSPPGSEASWARSFTNAHRTRSNWDQSGAQAQTLASRPSGLPAQPSSRAHSTPPQATKTETLPSLGRPFPVHCS